MNEEVNLLKYKYRKNETEAKGKRLLRLVSLLMLFTVSALSVTFFIFFILSPVPQLQSRVNSNLSVLDLSSDKMMHIASAEDRIKYLSRFYKSKFDYYTALDLINSLVNENIFIYQIQVEDKKLSVTFSSDNMGNFDRFTDTIKQESYIKKNFKAISSTVEYNERTKYFDLRIELKKI